MMSKTQTMRTSNRYAFMVAGQRPDHCCRKKRQQHADDETRRLPLGKHVRGQRPDPAEINGQQRQNSAAESGLQRISPTNHRPSRGNAPSAGNARSRRPKIFGQALDDIECRALMMSMCATAGPSTAVLMATKSINCSGGIVVLTARNDVGVRFWRKGAREATKKRENSSDLPVAAHFYSAEFDSRRERRRRAIPSCHADIVSPPAVPAFALRAADFRRDALSAACARAVLGTKAGVPAAQPGGRIAGAGGRGRTANSGATIVAEYIEETYTGESGGERRPPNGRAAGLRCAGWRTGSMTNSNRKSAGRW